MKTRTLTPQKVSKRPEAEAGHRERLILIQAVRLGFLTVILLITILFQSVQSEFVNPSVWIPFYLLLGFSFLINSIFLIYFENFVRIPFSNALIFGYDAVLITTLIYLTGIAQSIFLFLFLVNIILCGLVYQRRGAVALALWTSTLFSLLLVLGPEMQGQSLYFAIVLNNVAFFSVAILSGYLSEQIDFMGSALRERGQQIGELRDLNQLIIENVGTGLMTLDAGRTVQYINPSGSKILGFVDSVVGRDLAALLPGADDWMNTIRFRDRPLRSGSTTLNVEVNGSSPMVLQVMVSMLIGAEDQHRGYIVLFQDRTEFERMEAVIRQQEKMAAVGQLAAGIAHEIRNPLASISGSIQMLATPGAVSQEDTERLMRIVLREIDRLNGLITEFLDYVRPGVKREDPLSINQVVGEVLEMVRFNKTLRSDVAVDSRLESELVILGHRDKLKQALFNIVLNAYQAMEKSSVPRLEVRTWDDGDTVKLSIRDFGYGISQQTLPRIFEPFHTTKPKGTGLGLAITHKILQDHGAQILVESKEGQGTMFIIEFLGGRGRVEENRKLA
jgi:two-component system sensor histidine kinase PilS (NtrC family)